MNERKEMIDFALTRMSGFALERSSDGDNRSIFNLIKTLIQSAPDNMLTDCRKPLAAVLGIRARDQRDKFHGCKLMLLQQTIEALFGGSKNLLSDREFAGYKREMLLEYLEICRRVFIAKYVPMTMDKKSDSKANEPAYETDIQRAMRLAMERSERKGGKI